MKYFDELGKLFLRVEVKDQQDHALVLDETFSKIVNSILALDEQENKLIFIGNGGSASISSHMATDFLKNANIPALAFNDSSSLTCISNDLGYEHVFVKPLSMLAKKGDILFSISSSGESENILKATLEAKKKGCFVVSLSGFSKNNALRRMGDINFYLPSFSYGYVEVAHLTVCHCLVDMVVEKVNG